MTTARLHFMFFDAGGGHRAAATALEAVIAQQNRPWKVELINLQEYLDSIDVFRQITGVRLQDIYNNMLRKGWTLGSAYLVPPMHGIIRLFHGRQVRLLEDLWRREKPDLVVSVVPNLNRAMREGLRRASPGTPYVTIITDLADYPPHFWIERQDQYLVCGTERAVEQARALGHPEDRVFLTSGMILRPMFYDVPPVDRAAEHRHLGLDPDRPTALVLFGGQGSGVMLDIVRRLDRPGTRLQLILICGRNQKLADRLRALAPRHLRIHVEGFTTEIPRFMQLADFFIGKPGPGSISEAVAMSLPVIVERNAWTLPQERYNADWVIEKDVGFVLPSFRDIASAVDRILDGDTLPRLRNHAAALRNRAVFEIPDILENILSRVSEPRP